MRRRPKPSRLASLADEIADQARQDGLVLFLGAGVNGSAGFGWDGLLQQLLSRATTSAVVPSGDAKARQVDIGAGYDYYAKASIAAMLLGPRLFVPRLQGILYSRIQQFGGLRQLRELCREGVGRPSTRVSDLASARNGAAFGFLASLARLCMCPQIVAVVTYNYDTLLELAMAYAGQVGSGPDRWNTRTPVIVARQTPRAKRTPRPALNVYHVHGCVPPPGGLLRAEDSPIVLTQRDYARTMQNPYAWEESTQVHFLRSFPCLFLGLSMSDWNMLRLLHSANSSGVPDGRLHCIGTAEGGLHTEIRQRLLAGHGVSFRSAGPTPRGYAAVRTFADELFFNLHQSP